MQKSILDTTEANFFKKIEESGIAVPEAVKQSIQRKFAEIHGYVPKVGVFGKTGVGKSSLCNALFGEDVCSISDVQACTRDPQEVMLKLGNSGGIKLLDVPGVGEDRKRDDEYDALYKKLLPELDLIFWVFKGDDRANASDEDFYKRLIRPYIDAGKPFLAVVNQVDKIEPFREWNEEENLPGPKQQKNIKDKRAHMANFLRLPIAQVVPVSANERYGLTELVDAIVHALPNDKKAIVLHNIQTAEEIRKQAAAEAEEKARQEAEKARKAAEEAHQRAMQAAREKQQQLEEEARLARLRQQWAEDKAERARLERQREVDRLSIISESTRREASKGLIDTVLDAAENIPVVGRAVRFFRSLF